jgi:hydantoinase/carbamoylase family amidase
MARSDRHLAIGIFRFATELAHVNGEFVNDGGSDMVVSGARRGDPDRLHEMTVALAKFGQVGPTAVTRIAFTDADEAAANFVESRMREVGLVVRVDEFGNVFGRREGAQPGGPVVLTGSHIDGPPDGGMFDGTVGVICAIEACRLLDEKQVRTSAAIEVVAIRCEHLDRFGVSCLGSRALAGKLTEEDLDELRDDGGQSVREVLLSRGYMRKPLESVKLASDVFAFIELHIEQGRVLEDIGEQLGVVTGIAGPTRFRFHINGPADHSGGTPMSLRRDALCGAAEIILELERLALASSSTVGTIGVIEARPGAVHTIPGEVDFDVDIRGVEADEKVRIVEEFLVQASAIARRRGLDIVYTTSVDESPVSCSPWVRRELGESLRKVGLSFIEMPSGGGHDSQHLAACTDVGMLFIPSVGGISHTPQEFSRWEDLAVGAGALSHCLERLATISRGEDGYRRAVQRMV